MNPKQFLEQECKNVKEFLKDTLRYKYGSNVSKKYFSECNNRLKYISDEIDNTDPKDLVGLHKNGSLLNELTGLISRIERSSLGNYSWPFVEQLKKISENICTEQTLLNPNTPPIFHIFSGEGLSSYAIYPEQNRVRVSKNRILTIVFPRTLKHFVLLHSILGHEIGHAIWRSQSHQHKLSQIMESQLFRSGGPFLDRKTTAEWLYSDDAPNEVKAQLNIFKNKFRQFKTLTKDNFFDIFADWDAWKEEILCDFIGLLTFGPSFVAAHCQLLYAIVPSGINVGPKHPPVGFRVNLMLAASRILGYETIDGLPKGEILDTLNKFWGELKGKKQTGTWFNPFSDEQIKNVLVELQNLIDSYPPASFELPQKELLEKLFLQLVSKVPPLGFEMSSDDPVLNEVDFRHILYIGWIATHHHSQIPFDIINRLCEHAIMQQIGINTYISQTKKTAK